ncbi:heterokaryon incompatibility protein-domain-containing protein [Trametes meyenii]|nr:heterokaryon incompatibility protein-domain-containing protein [Trametes meyenii]
MRFLDTYSGEFVSVDNLNEARYAILSHTWQTKEQSYDDIRSIQLEVAETQHNVAGQPTAFEPPKSQSETGTVPLSQETVFSHPRISEKIKCSCKVAREAGYRLLWIDSCCINNSSSAELSEAINSMYEWYSRSDVCFAYLSDVPDIDDPAETPGHPFSRSRWHKRGWTLQELIAPRRVVFLTCTWGFLGTKMGLASTLETVTGVDFAILTGTAGLASVSVARRMSWACRRKTTRIEDEAYALMGIFGVHMSPIYGEGNNAFLRLQEEIIRNIPDQTIFVWGPQCTLTTLDQAERPLVFQWTPTELGLLASSPARFYSGVYRGITPLSPVEFGARLGRSEEELPPLHCLFTPQGIRIQLLCLDLSRLPQSIRALLKAVEPGISGSCTDCRRRGVAHYLALLRCSTSSEEGSLIALPLCRPNQLEDLEQNFGEGLFTATHMACDSGHEPFRFVCLTRSFLLALLDIKSPPILRVKAFVHKSLVLSQRWGYGSTPLLSRDRLNDPSAVHLSPWCTKELSALGFVLSPVKCNPGPEWVLENTNVLELTAVTTISFLPPSVGPVDTSSAPRPRPEASAQEIRIQVILPCRERRAIWNTGVDHAWRVETAHITISHMFFQANPPGGNTHYPLPGPQQYNGLAHWKRPAGAHASAPGLARAEFVLHADVASTRGGNLDARLLCVTLEPQTISDSTPDVLRMCHSLRLSVELSQRYGQGILCTLVRLRTQSESSVSCNDNNMLCYQGIQNGVEAQERSQFSPCVSECRLVSPW